MANVKLATSRQTTEAVAWFPDVVLGNHSGKRSMGIELRKGDVPIGTFYFAKGGIEYRKPKQKTQGKRISWQKLAEMLGEE